ncbi:MAG: hypothetical protein UR64_C0001G0032 [Candidatus Nomurabacteria bacterium GW2011_GWE1_35_16]|uniref:Uncharacterized protein n=1 Tax=Candidatus Nomurabacteria bacterium GW2011_GWE1_35_16 TaxID=1618761 RepID=A0A0G0BBT8_9BACT|nr:MAG: hypothetical protein UR55_C0001G0032 [Candidatus Nomurabacteria bacterium GW2011_GWF1_34_20]KKP63741.1 MAG: hypothetical protein UR57_C0001G0032 [Candidatus Nomurabacteria bacterium GW2011_GWE2_34_25]KKP66953.1 MAG: hypothetical protein UR64_C0001G0032 [Candidatus Nomurabacteria bacterium GW2011_GWE1_35_16]
MFIDIINNLNLNLWTQQIHPVQSLYIEELK